MSHPALTGAPPKETPLVRLVEMHVDEIRSQWEELFEGRDGFLRSPIDKAVGATLDCGILDSGFACAQRPQMDRQRA